MRKVFTTVATHDGPVLNVSAAYLEPVLNNQLPTARIQTIFKTNAPSQVPDTGLVGSQSFLFGRRIFWQFSVLVLTTHFLRPNKRGFQNFDGTLYRVLACIDKDLVMLFGWYF